MLTFHQRGADSVVAAALQDLGPVVRPPRTEHPGQEAAPLLPAPTEHLVRAMVTEEVKDQAGSDLAAPRQAPTEFPETVGLATAAVLPVLTELPVRLAVTTDSEEATVVGLPALTGLREAVPTVMVSDQPRQALTVPRATDLGLAVEATEWALLRPTEHHRNLVVMAPEDLPAHTEPRERATEDSVAVMAGHRAPTEHPALVTVDLEPADLLAPTEPLELATEDSVAVTEDRQAPTEPLELVTEDSEAKVEGHQVLTEPLGPATEDSAVKTEGPQEATVPPELEVQETADLEAHLEALLVHMVLQVQEVWEVVLEAPRTHTVPLVVELMDTPEETALGLAEAAVVDRATEAELEETTAYL